VRLAEESIDQLARDLADRADWAMRV